MPIAVTDPALQTLAGILVFDVTIDDEAINLTSSELSQVTITNMEGQHESALITTQLTKAQIARFVDQPMSFSYGSKINSTTFYGYVAAIAPNADYNEDTIVDITCVGVTWPMQSGTAKFVRDITAPDMFAAIVTGGFRQDISTGYNLGAQVDTHSYVWPVLAQSDESDWAFLQTLAQRIGYAVYNYQGVVRLVQPRRILTETPIAASFIKSDQILDQTRTLLDWSASTQSQSLRDNMHPSYGFFDGTAAAVSKPLVDTSLAPVTTNGAVTTLTATPSQTALLVSPYRFDSTTPIKDRAMADAYTNAWLDRIDYWNEAAQARIGGNARMIPGVNISVQVSGVPNGTNDYDGVWLVRSVQHVLTHNAFQTQLGLARDSQITTGQFNTSSNWFWNVPRGSPKVLRDPVTNKWKSSWGGAPEFIQNTLTV